MSLYFKNSGREIASIPKAMQIYDVNNTPLLRGIFYVTCIPSMSVNAEQKNTRYAVLA
jgi:hypothetical protein